MGVTQSGGEGPVHGGQSGVEEPEAVMGGDHQWTEAGGRLG